ncbi:MAG: hypothetical protein ACTS27_06725 [Phycisphaerales bacterium]
MDPIGSHIAQSVAGAPQASKAAARRKRVEEKDDARPRDEDVVDVPVTEVDETEPARRVGANGEEDSREDREAHGYSVRGPSKKLPKGENLDLSA